MPRAQPGVRQKQLMVLIRETHQYQPSLAELAAWMDAPLSTTHEALAALERAGLVVVHNRGKQSGLRIRPRRTA